jgi:TolA-binding protein
LKLPPQEREAQDLLFMGEFLLAAGKGDQGRRALQQVVGKYPGTASAAAARERLEQKK